jgi:hypothetical protein
MENRFLGHSGLTWLQGVSGELAAASRNRGWIRMGLVSIALAWCFWGVPDLLEILLQSGALMGTTYVAYVVILQSPILFLNPWLGFFIYLPDSV